MLVSLLSDHLPLFCSYFCMKKLNLYFQNWMRYFYNISRLTLNDFYIFFQNYILQLDSFHIVPKHWYEFMTCVTSRVTSVLHFGLRHSRAQNLKKKLCPKSPPKNLVFWLIFRLFCGEMGTIFKFWRKYMQKAGFWAISR